MIQLLETQSTQRKYIASYPTSSQEARGWEHVSL